MCVIILGEWVHTCIFGAKLSNPYVTRIIYMWHASFIRNVCVYIYIYIHIYGSWHIWMSYVTYEWVMWHMNESYHTWNIIRTSPTQHYNLISLLRKMPYTLHPGGDLNKSLWSIRCGGGGGGAYVSLWSGWKRPFFKGGTFGGIRGPYRFGRFSVRPVLLARLARCVFVYLCMCMHVYIILLAVCVCMYMYMCICG